MLAKLNNEIYSGAYMSVLISSPHCHELFCNDALKNVCIICIFP